MKEDCGMLIKQISSTMKKNGDNALRQQNLTFTQVSALLLLRGTLGRQATFKDLERLLHLAQSTTAGIIGRLAGKGLVECFCDEADRRVKLVRLTDRGEDCCRQAEQGMQEAEQRLLAGLTEAEIEVFRGLLQRVNNNLK